MSLADELQKLNDLKQSGALTESEYQQAKEALLAQNQPVPPGSAFFDANTWGLLIHLSQFFFFLIPLAGLLVPLVLWQVKKNESEIIDQHGKIVMNWLLTEIVLGVACGMLIFLFVGVPLLMCLIALGIIFPVIGALKAGAGEVWPYPCSLRFLK